LPLISSDGGALPEVVGKHLETGYIVKSRDSSSLAEAIDYFIDNPDIREKMGRAARKRIMEVFTWRNAALEIVQTYKEVIDAYSRLR
jgi:glycosyltransferase involved in cell wall biosynthesis